MAGLAIDDRRAQKSIDWRQASLQRQAAKAAGVVNLHQQMQHARPPPAAVNDLARYAAARIDGRTLSMMSPPDVERMVESMLRGQLVKLNQDALRDIARQVTRVLMRSSNMSAFHPSYVSLTTTTGGGLTGGVTTLSNATGNVLWSSGAAATSSTASQVMYLQAAQASMMQAHIAQQQAQMQQAMMYGTGSIANHVGNSLYASQHVQNPFDSALVRDSLRLMGDCSVADGEAATIKLPDGGRLVVARDGSYVMEDKDAKVTYRASKVRDFNSYMNASDKIEGFIAYCGAQGVRRDEFMKLPIELFIMWLVIEAAKADREETPDVPLLPAIAKVTAPRCGCGRFLARRKVQAGLIFCRTACFERANARFSCVPLAKVA